MSGPGDDEPPPPDAEPEGGEEAVGAALDEGAQKPVISAEDLQEAVAKVFSMAEEKKKRANDKRREQKAARRPSRDEALEGAFKPFPMDGKAPVRPLGVIGSEYHFLDALNQHVVKSADKLSQNGIDDLFKTEKAMRWALENYTRITQEGKVTVDRDLLKRSIMAACGDANDGTAFDSAGRIKGVGAWLDEGGQLIWHMGDALMVQTGGSWREAPVGMREGGRLIFPAGTPQPRPLDNVELAAGKSVEQRAGDFLELLNSWSWKGGELDARLLLGWIVCSQASGALKWRPNAWVTGDWGWGKSTIHTIIKALCGGDDAIVQAADATAAGIWQTLRSRSLPVALDEVEASADNTKKEQVLELARESASGATKLRGTGEHTGISFAINSCFFFSSIVMLPMKPQDKSRTIILELGPFPSGAKQPAIDRDDLLLTGRAFRRRILDIWPTLDAHLQPWWKAIFEATNEPRCADVFGTALAFQHAVLHENPADASDVDEWVKVLGPRLAELLTESGRDHDEMVGHLATMQLESWEKGQRFTVRQYAWAAAGWPEALEKYEADDDRSATVPEKLDRKKCNGVLAKYQMRVVRPREGEHQNKQFLAIAFKGRSLGGLFFKTRWQGGAWVQSALRVPGSFKAKQRIDGPAEWAVLVPVEALLGERPAAGDGMP